MLWYSNTNNYSLLKTIRIIMVSKANTGMEKRMIDRIDVVSILVLLFMVNNYLFSWTKEWLRHYERLSKINGTFIKEREDIQNNRNRIRNLCIFVLISGNLLAFGMLLLYGIPQIFGSIPDTVSELLNTGIHVPIILVLFGLAIRLAYGLFLKCKDGKDNIDVKEKTNILIIMSLALNLCFLSINWKLSFFTLGIILGKYLWIDFVFDYNSLKQEVNIIVRKVKSKELTAEFFVLNYAFLFIGWFHMLKLISLLTTLGRNIDDNMRWFIMIASYIVMYSSLNSMIGRLQIQLARETFIEIEKIKKK